MNLFLFGVQTLFKLLNLIEARLSDLFELLRVRLFQLHPF